jgi:hypothetical protein
MTREAHFPILPPTPQRTPVTSRRVAAVKKRTYLTHFGGSRVRELTTSVVICPPQPTVCQTMAEMTKRDGKRERQSAYPAMSYLI